MVVIISLQRAIQPVVPLGVSILIPVLNNVAELECFRSVIKGIVAIHYSSEGMIDVLHYDAIAFHAELGLGLLPMIGECHLYVFSCREFFIGKFYGMRY